MSQDQDASMARETTPLVGWSLSPQNSSRGVSRQNSTRGVSRQNTVTEPACTLLSSSSGQPSLIRVRLTLGIILIVLILERSAFYGLTGNLVLFLSEFSSQPGSITASLYFLSISFLTCLLGGWIADSFIGRYMTILISLFVYVAGYVILVLISKQILSGCDSLIYPSLTVVAVGVGLVKSNIPPIGADQLCGEGQQIALSFFNWLYWCINLGALIGLVAFTCIEQYISFFDGYLCGVGALVMAALLTIFGGFYFKRKQPEGSILTKVFRIINEARKLHKKKRCVDKINRQHGFQVNSTEGALECLSMLDYAKIQHGGSFHEVLVEDVKVLKKILCVLIALIPYWIVYFQMETTFLLQGLHMKLNMSATDKPFTVVVAWLNVFDMVVIIFLLPLMDRFVYPFLERRGIKFSMMRRIGLGMLFATLSMLVAGVIETRRITYPTVIQSIAHEYYNGSTMSIFYQIPQYTLIGISEVFTSVAGLQFACSVAPNSMKSIIVGLFYLFSGLGSLMGTGIMGILTASTSWMTDSGTSGVKNSPPHLNYYFFLLAAISALGFCAFVLAVRVMSLDSIDEKPTRFTVTADRNYQEASSTSLNDPTRKRHSYQ